MTTILNASDFAQFATALVGLISASIFGLLAIRLAPVRRRAITGRPQPGTEIAITVTPATEERFRRN